MATRVDESLVSLLRLAMVPGIGPRTLTSILEAFGSAQEAMSAPSGQLERVPGIGPKLMQAIGNAHRRVDVDGLLEQCRELDIDIVLQDSPEYPQRLLELCDAPPVLFMRGSVLPQDTLAVAIVGTRHPSSYGRTQTESIVRGLARAGVTIVSGLARGIDGIAHEAALDVGGRTIAVLGGGMADIYPPEHAGLAQAVVADGALLSEYSPRAKPRSGMFPQRNRLISGLSLVVCVMEAADRSGALITARLAGEQGRDCCALPGPVNSRVSQGTNKLIRDGAILIQSADDILELLGPLHAPLGETQSLGEPQSAGENQSAGERGPAMSSSHHRAQLTLNEDELLVLNAIELPSTTIDSIIAVTGLPTHQVLSTISALEMRRLIRRERGQSLVRV